MRFAAAPTVLDDTPSSMLPSMDHLLLTAMMLLLVVQNPGGVSRPRRDKHHLCRHTRTVTLRGAPSPATDLSLMLQMVLRGGAKVASFGRRCGRQGAAGRDING